MGKINLYGSDWSDLSHPVSREIDCIRRGGQWVDSKGRTCGMGLFFHLKRIQELLWPEKVWHRWALEQLDCYVNYRMIGVIGPASSGKTHEAATNCLADYYCFSDTTTILVCSTEREMLEMRVWGEIKKYHRLAKQRVEWLSGNLIESRQRIVTDGKQWSAEGRDFRNGIVGVPCKKGGNYQGLGSFIGIKNKRVRLIVDEAHLIPRTFLDAIANLNKNKDFKCEVLGNPKDTTDSLGVFCEPHASIGGWEGGIDQTPKTKRWSTRFDRGICLQLPGSDCPNMDVAEDQPVPYPFLITRQAIAADVQFYGQDSLQYTMMDEGRMPRGVGTRRVLTRQLCLRFGAMEPVVWKNEQRTRIGFLDAAYRGVGGDRCIFGELQFGFDANDNSVIAIIEHMLVPIVEDSLNSVEDQIALFCKDQCERRGIVPENMGFDSTGRGTLMSAFARLWSPYVVPVEFGGKASDRRVSADVDKLCREHYSKFVTELWWSFRLCIESGQMRQLTNDAIEEGTQREWKLVSGNRIEIETKEDMKVKSGRSPDIMDAHVVGVEMARRRGFVIRKLAKAAMVHKSTGVYEALQEKMNRLRDAHALTFS